MKIYEEVIKDLDGLLKFVKDADLTFDCDICQKHCLECSGNDCNDNLIKYLQMDKIEENVPENEISMDEFNKFISKIRTLVGRINNMDTYTEVNYIRNHMKDLEDRGIVSGINHLESLKGTIDKYK